MASWKWSSGVAKDGQQHPNQTPPRFHEPFFAYLNSHQKLEVLQTNIYLNYKDK
jgi:hypothetical protein